MWPDGLIDLRGSKLSSLIFGFPKWQTEAQESQGGCPGPGSEEVRASFLPRNLWDPEEQRGEVQKRGAGLQSQSRGFQSVQEPGLATGAVRRARPTAAIGRPARLGCEPGGRGPDSSALEGTLLANVGCRGGCGQM